MQLFTLTNTLIPRVCLDLYVRINDAWKPQDGVTVWRQIVSKLLLQLFIVYHNLCYRDLNYVV